MIDSQKYRNLEQQLREAKNKIEELNETHGELLFEIKTNVIVDDKVIEEESFENIIDNYDNIFDEIKEVLIPIINSKI